MSKRRQGAVEGECGEVRGAQFPAAIGIDDDIDLGADCRKLRACAVEDMDDDAYPFLARSAERLRILTDVEFASLAVDEAGQSLAH